MSEEKNEIISSRALTLISHKLKTPLSIINGYSEAILSQAGKEKFSPFTSKALEEIHKQGGKMSRLVNKLFDFNKVTSAKAEDLEREDVALKPLIKDCASCAVAREEVPAVPVTVIRRNLMRSDRFTVCFQGAAWNWKKSGNSD